MLTCVWVYFCMHLRDGTTMWMVHTTCKCMWSLCVCMCVHAWVSAIQVQEDTFLFFLDRCTHIVEHVVMAASLWLVIVVAIAMTCPLCNVAWQLNFYLSIFLIRLQVTAVLYKLPENLLLKFPLCIFNFLVKRTQHKKMFKSFRMLDCAGWLFLQWKPWLSQHHCVKHP